ncbi:hypothetical protein HPP92_018171 [Vanilla planifolia]|uniref:rRNA adenine N(6)-methyltransferase n=1 Tax=Vanilla planifolia TaxID=51239 RepID=A0A835Q9E4_VANPL|nr:hypothetical protein HPP92_018171 [Vanilla planifolia]
MNVGKKNFVPSPKVDSSLVCIQPKLDKPDVDLDEWLCFTRTCFSKKNKTLGAIFKQKRKIIELYSKLKSSHKNIKTTEYEEHTSHCDVDDRSESDDCDIWPTTSELENQNFAEVVWFREKILKILEDGGFCEKRPSKLSNEDFLGLLQLFNKEGVFFHQE